MRLLCKIVAVLDPTPSRPARKGPIHSSLTKLHSAVQKSDRVLSKMPTDPARQHIRQWYAVRVNDHDQVLDGRVVLLFRLLHTHCESRVHRVTRTRRKPLRESQNNPPVESGHSGFRAHRGHPLCWQLAANLRFQALVLQTLALQHFC